MNVPPKKLWARLALTNLSLVLAALSTNGFYYCGNLIPRFGQCSGDQWGNIQLAVWLGKYDDLQLGFFFVRLFMFQYFFLDSLVLGSFLSCWWNITLEYWQIKIVLRKWVIFHFRASEYLNVLRFWCFNRFHEHNTHKIPAKMCRLISCHENGFFLAWIRLNHLIKMYYFKYKLRRKISQKWK